MKKQKNSTRRSGKDSASHRVRGAKSSIHVVTQSSSSGQVEDKSESVQDATLILSRSEAIALYQFFIDTGYISYEHHPVIHEISKKCQDTIGSDAVNYMVESKMKKGYGHIHNRS